MRRSGQYLQGMAKRFLDAYDVVLLDVGGTFMFDCDRFDETMARTYARMGGRSLCPAQVQTILGDLYTQMLAIGRDPCCHDNFPRVRSHLARLETAENLGWDELDLLARVFAAHEVGHIPESSAEILHALGGNHRLGVVSNVWSDSDIFLNAFNQAGIEDLLDVIVFSSDHGWIKPSRRLFDKAIEYLQIPRERIVHVGNSFDCDVVGARRAGIAAVWINPEGLEPPANEPIPDLTLQNLGQLLEA